MSARAIPPFAFAVFLSISLSRADEARTPTTVTLKYSGARYEEPFWIISGYPPIKRIDASKKKFVWNGMTVGNLVTALGKGWEGSWDNVGIISWQFDDNTELLVPLSQPLKPNTILTFDPAGRGIKMRWQKR